MLLTMKAFVEGARALGLWVGMQLDILAHSPDAKAREAADDLLAIMTPICKAYFTDMGYEVTNLGMQIYGGHGYIHDYGMEQFARDARITQIYEGANGIQALDLVGRKLPAHMGRSLRRRSLRRLAKAFPPGRRNSWTCVSSRWWRICGPPSGAGGAGPRWPSFSPPAHRRFFMTRMLPEGASAMAASRRRR